MTQLEQLFVVFAHLVEIVACVTRARNLDHAVALEVAVDVVATNCCFNLVEVFQPQIFKQTYFFGEALLCVGYAVREARIHEAAVATARCRSNFV